MVFLASPYPQMDGSRFQSANCVAATTTELISLATVDRLHIPAWKIRQASGDTSGGIEYSVAAAAAYRVTNGEVSLASTRVVDWARVKEYLGTRSLGIIIDCSKTVRTAYRTNSFTGLHSVTVAGGTIRDGTVKVEDPGTTTAGWKAWPLDLLKRASLINGYHWLLVAPPTEDVDQTARIRAAVRAKPDNSSRVLRTLQKGDVVHVRKTRRGGPWRRPDGTLGHGWHVLRNGYVRGEGLS